MKITFVLPRAGMAGGIRVVAIYADRLQKRGHEVCIISQSSRPVKWQEQVRSLLMGRGWKSSWTESSYFDGLDVPHRILEGGRAVADDDLPDADVVIATWWETVEWLQNLSAAKGVKVHFIQDHELFDYLPRKRVQAVYRLPLYKITISKWLMDLIPSLYGRCTITLVPNSVEFSQFNAPSRCKPFPPTIGFVYTPTTRKGCDISIKAFSLAAETIPDLQLIAFGHREPTQNLPLPEGSTYYCSPPQMELKEIYSRCTAWLFGTRHEGFGLPILEAMACRTPVIATPAGAAPEILARGGGLLVQPEDPQDMARAIQSVCALSDADWQTLSQAAYENVTQYSWDDATDLFEAAPYDALKKRCA